MKKRYIILIIIGSVLIILSIIAHFYANSVIQKLVRKEINTLIEEQKDTYFIEVGEVNVQLFMRRFILSGVKVNSIDSIPSKKDIAFKLNIDRLIVKLDGFTDVLRDGTLKLQKIELDEPDIDFTYKIPNDSIAQKEQEPFKSNRINLIELSSFGINNGSFTLKKSDGSHVTLVTSISALDFEVDEIQLTLNENKLDDRISFNKILLDLGHVIYHDAKDHDISLSDLRYSNKNKGIDIKEILLRSKFNKDSITHDFSNKDPWIESKANDLRIVIDLQLLKKKQVYIPKIEIGKLDLDLYQNKNKKTPFNLSVILAKIPIPISLDTIQINKGTVDISLSNENGKIDDFALNKINVNVHHLSNDSTYIQNNSTIKGKVKSNIWIKGGVDARFSYNILTKRRSVKIKLTSIPERKLIKYINEEKLAHLRSVNLNKMEIDFSSDSAHYEGKVSADISKLDIVYSKFNKFSKIKSIKTKFDQLSLSSSFYKKYDEEINLFIESFIVQSPRVIVTERDNLIIKDIDSNKKKKTMQGIVSIDLLDIRDASIDYIKENQDEKILSIESATILEKSLVINLAKSRDEMIVSSGEFKIDVSHIDVFQTPYNYLNIKSLSIEKSKNKIDVVGLRFKNKTSKNSFHASSSEGNIWNSIYAEKIAINADLNRLLKNEFYFNKVKIVRPILTYIKAIDRIEKTVEKEEKKLNFSYPFTINALSIIDADIEFRVKTKEIKEFEVFDLSNFNGIIKNIKLNPINKNESQILTASFQANFFKDGKISLDFEHDLASKNGKSHIEAKAENIEMDIVKNKVSIFKKIDYFNGELNEIQVNVDIIDKKIKGFIALDSLNVDKFMLGSEKNSDWLAFKFDEIISHFTLSKKEGYKISNLQLKNPQVDIHHILSETNTPKTELKRSSIFAEKGVFKEFATIDKIDIENGIIKQYKGNGKKTPITTIKNLNIKAENIAIYDSTNTTIPMSINGLDIKMNNIIVHSFPLYDMTIESSSLNLLTKKVTLTNIEFKNKKTPTEFYKGLEYRKAWMDLVVPKIVVDIKFKDFFSTHPRISKAVASDVIFTAIVNVGLDVSPIEKPFPNRVLANSLFPLTVDSILIKDSQLNVKFKNYNENTKHGILQFNEVNASVSNLTSDKEKIKENNEMIWNFNSTLWQSGKTHAVVKYKLDSDNDDFFMYGKVENLNMIECDTLTSHLYGIAVNDGILHHTYFEINGNNDEASGFVRFDYEDLKVSLEKKKKNTKGQDELKKVKKKDKLNQSFVKSMVANGAISKKNLPDDNNYIAQGEAYFKREKDKPIFALMWFTISSGIIEIAEAPLVSTLSKWGSVFKKEDQEGEDVKKEEEGEEEGEGEEE